MVRVVDDISVWLETTSRRVRYCVDERTSEAIEIFDEHHDAVRKKSALEYGRELRDYKHLVGTVLTLYPR